MDLQFLKNYFSQDYQGIKSILQSVFIPIFGADNFEDGLDVLTSGDTAFARKAKEHKIISITYYGKFYTEDLELNIYDVTLDSSAHIATSRVGIRQIVAEMVEAFDGALVVFHYAGNASNRSWRLSYIEKIKGMQRKAKRFTYLCGQNYSCRTIAERFVELQHSAKNAKALEAAFSVEALSDEFFTDYKKQYETFCNYIEDNKNDASRFGYEFSQEEGKYIRDYVKKMLGRLTFLCFLQRRGWLGVPVTEKDWYGGDTQFLFNLYRKATDEQRENFLDEILEPLFFDCLNEKREGDIFDTKVQAIGKVKIPYLNGGLFDKDEIDKPRSVFPAKLFGNLFEFFASYNFTIDENDPNDAEVGVDPEMLGKIFENLLEGNKDNGTFYTPKEIVHYMCRESLIAYLIDEAKSKSTTTENFEDAIRTFISDPEISVKRITQYYDASQLSDLSQSLKSVKICDPAIGSGAFPMGLLNLIYRCRLFLNQALGIKQTAAQLKQEIIQNNIYGVDIEKGAIDIARLRFWLSIIVDAEVPEPLPNFDYKFMQGNSLVEQFEGVNLIELLPKEEENNGLRLIFTEEQAQHEVLKNRQEQYFKENDHKRKYELREQINSAVKDLICTCTPGRNDIASALEKVNVSANTQFFLWHTWFADVFNRPGKSGFDIVIGNPPYIGIKGHSDLFVPLRQDSAMSKFFMGKMDYFYFFFHQALNILRPNGVASFITTNYYPTADGASKLRVDLRDRAIISHLLNLGELRLFENAPGQHNMITILSKGQNHNSICQLSNVHRKGALNSTMFSDIINKRDTETYYGEVLQQNLYDGKEAYIRTQQGNKNDAAEDILEKIVDGNELLGDVCGVFQGIVSGADKVSQKHLDNYPINRIKDDGIFVLQTDNDYDKSILDMLSGTNEEGIVKPLFKNSDISKYVTNEDVLKYVLFIGKEIKSENELKLKYPNIYSHLIQYRQILVDKRESLNENTAQWFTLNRGTGHPSIFTSPKIVCPQRSKSNTFGYNESVWYATSDVFVISAQDEAYKLKYILGLLNSRLYYFWLYNRGKRKGETLELTATPLSEIPIKKVSDELQQSIVKIVDVILAKKKSKPDADTSAEEKEIDRLVYELYGISETEQQLIEQA